MKYNFLKLQRMYIADNKILQVDTFFSRKAVLRLVKNEIQCRYRQFHKLF